MKLWLRSNSFTSRVWVSYLKKKEPSVTVWSLLVFFFGSVGEPRERTTRARLWFILLESSVRFPPHR